MHKWPFYWKTGHGEKDESENLTPESLGYRLAQNFFTL